MSQAREGIADTRADITGRAALIAHRNAPPNLQGAPTWTTWYEIFGVVGDAPFLKRTVCIASVVGSLLFAINHLDELIAERQRRGYTSKWD